jgi:hypothetical protein
VGPAADLVRRVRQDGSPTRHTAVAVDLRARLVEVSPCSLAFPDGCGCDLSTDATDPADTTESV